MTAPVDVKALRELLAAHGDPSRPWPHAGLAKAAADALPALLDEIEETRKQRDETREELAALKAMHAALLETQSPDLDAMARRVLNRIGRKDRRRDETAMQFIRAALEEPK